MRPCQCVVTWWWRELAARQTPPVAESVGGVTLTAHWRHDGVRRTVAGHDDAGTDSGIGLYGYVIEENKKAPVILVKGSSS